MSEEKIVQFVSFETILAKAQFISHWEKFTRSDYSEGNVVLHQSETNGSFKYLAKHSYSGGFKFIFQKERRSSKDRQVSIKVVQEGGYQVLQLAHPGDCETDESKVFCFIQNPETDLKMVGKMFSNQPFNIYAAYYENCRFAYILEFFVRNNQVTHLFEMLTQQGFDHVGIFKECEMQLT